VRSNGSIAPNEGSTSCTACPADTISVPVYGGTFCQPCGHIPHSTYECEIPSTPPTPQHTLAPDLFSTPCNKPGYGLDYNANNVLDCRPCRRGWHDDGRVESRFCITCYNSIAPQEGTIDCIKCPAGSISVPEYSPSRGLYCSVVPTNAPTETPSKASISIPEPPKAPFPAPTVKPTKPKPTRRPTKAKPAYPPSSLPPPVAFL
jgi:hypothetical protein